MIVGFETGPSRGDVRMGKGCKREEVCLESNQVCRGPLLNLSAQATWGASLAQHFIAYQKSVNAWHVVQKSALLRVGVCRLRGWQTNNSQGHCRECESNFKPSHHSPSVKSGECAVCEGLQERRGLGWCCSPGPPAAAGLVSAHAVPTAGMGS